MGLAQDALAVDARVGACGTEAVAVAPDALPAEVEGRLAGYSCYGRIPCSEVSWDLYWIAVAPEQQGSGLGRRILDLTEQRIAAAGGLAVYAETSGRGQYAPTRAFYERCGYATGAVFADFYAAGDAKHVFVKRLG